MSDDTPTQRFDVGEGGDAPTERLAAPTAATVPPVEPKSRRAVIILAIVGGVLLLALIAVLVILLTRGSGTPAVLPTPSASATPTATASITPSPSPTPSETPTPTPTATTQPVPPPSTDPSVDSFTINPATVSCTSSSTVVITLQWSTSNANTIYFGVDTNDASNAPFFGDSLPASGNSTNDFPDGYRPFDYTCGNGSHKYTITAVSADGTKNVSATVTVTG